MPDLIDVPFTDTSAEDLCFTLTGPRLTGVRSTSVCIGPGLRLDLVVLGCSHQAVLVDEAAPGSGPHGTGTDLLVETVACLPDAEPSLPAEPVAEAIAGLPGMHRFDVRVDRHPVGDPGFASAVDGITAAVQDGLGGLAVCFPGDPSAVTALVCDAADERRIAWRTWHCYPQHGQIVATRSDVMLDTAPQPVRAGEEAR